jgi:elongation factor P--(R)-beta-lysine ligase
LRARADLFASVRGFFAEREVLEVETPLLSSCFGTDPSIEPLRSRFTGPGYADGRNLYLQSSPEFFMKRLLAAGSGAIYQIAKAFRDGEAGRRHNPEFTMLEWYRPGWDAAQLTDEVAELVGRLLGRPELPVARYRYGDLFRDCLGIDVFDTTADALQSFASEQHLLGADHLQLDRDGWLNLLMSVLIEPDLGKDELAFVTDYPASQASLARLNPQDPRTAARFELYYRGMELANGFEELADADEQAARFEKENCRRYSGGQSPMPVDEALLGALEAGLPACSGVALGLDRVLMCALGVEDIDQVLAFSLARI